MGEFANERLFAKQDSNGNGSSFEAFRKVDKQNRGDLRSIESGMKNYRHPMISHSTLRRGLFASAIASRYRSGFTITEILIAGLLLGTVTVTVIPLIQVVAGERSAAQRRQFAIEEVENILEELTLRDWEEVTAETATIELSETAQDYLPNAELEVGINDNSDSPASKRIDVSLKWKGRNGTFLAPVRLSAWVFERKTDET